MTEPVCIADMEVIAKKNIEKSSWDFYRSGATTEQTLEDNCLAFKRYRLRPQVLNDVSSVDMSTSVLGSKLEFPICISATAMNKMADPGGEVSAAKAAGSLATGYMLSTWATSSIEEVSNANPTSIKWFQLYVFKDRALTRRLVQRAERCGFKGIFLTVDTPVLGNIYVDARNGFTLPPHLSFANLDRSQSKGSNSLGVEDYITSLHDPSLKWSDIDWLKSITKLPVVLKGILTARMAIKAIKHNVDGIVVSNHGGRQLDGVPATIDALSEVVRAVNGKCEVYLDGGVRTGTDVLKAIALGAKAVFIGRPVLWGLAYKGEEGVKRVLEILKDEFKSSMQLMGCTSIKSLQENQNLVVLQSYYKSLL